ncbi:DUF4405 domain-containing protein [Thalassotalea sp. M1531]|uniref:DUF4405 domain-containing protein n=1 Tax=Thalassotalea algicola TaxID=2716224 RepID=A0A7Y0Q847_9GAMM|nr:DUF4405 domain-containing protein [Thalassotalea algicola]NMP31745.1 DUF4405 domain-containing protein [Thalassotalea algicola]
MLFFSSRFTARAFIGATLFIAFLVMLVTSVLLFSKQHSNLIALIHTLIGLVMVLTVIWHLFKNSRSLGQYLNPFKKQGGKFTITLPLALILIIYFVASPFLRLSPAMEVYRLGQSLKAADKGTDDEEHTFIERALKPDNATGQTITVELKKGAYFLWPQYAIWLETLDGEFVQPLYVTSAIGTNNFVNKVSKKDPSQVFTSHLMVGPDANPGEALTGGEDPESKDSRMRPESLPVFLHQLGMKAANGYFVPTGDSLTVDGYSGATMTDNFIYHAQLPSKLSGEYRVRLELNNSFDFNDYYSSDRFPDDEVYSGDGFSAQPSVVYQAVIDFDQPEQLLKMELIGRGHHSGRDGKIYGDIDNLTTALELVDRAIVSIASE